MSEWPQVPFASLLREPVRNGIYKPKKFHGRGAKIVNMGELFRHPRLRAIQMKRVALSPSELDRFSLSVGDLIFARRSLTAEGAGKCSVILEIDEDTTFESSIIRARPDEDRANSLFLYYFFSSTVGAHRLDTIRRQVAVAGITGSDLSQLRIPAPPVSEQRAIASVLGALDDKIELNRRMNETLEAMARAIFKDWFVDFGPTRAKIEGRAPYLAPDIWSLFPDRLDDEGKPEGWKSFLLSDLAVQQKQGISPSAAPEIEFEHFSLPAYDSGKSPAIDLGGTILSSKTAVPQGAVLLSKLNPEIERVWIPEPAGDRQQICSTEFLVFVPTTLSARSLLYGLFTNCSFREMLQSMVTGTSKSHQRISPSSLQNREVLIGTQAAFALYEEIVGPILERVLANRAEARTLAATRDLFLPKLMSGEIRVKELESAF